MKDQWLKWAQRIQALSQAGLTFSRDAFDRERYEELRKISKEMMALQSELTMQQLNLLFDKEQGYPTPKVDVRGVVFKDNTILMVREKMDDKWSLPGGFCEVGLSPSENIAKEINEESGYHVVPIKLLSLLDTNKHEHPPQPFHYYKIFIQCEIVGGSQQIGIETNDIAFFSENHLPNLSLRRNTQEQIHMLFEFYRNPNKSTVID
ncbi:MULTISPECIES: NUDIX hydrolase [Virgibacillus]|uniref:Nudix hydrolase domain-containing protein n=2 Tax=Virgibacillus TaxID=84406 RepID=A0A024QF86_9BACI|nr:MULTISPECIES: NUDIX hydrolase [Virgibacillus]EQB37196.1 hypothetical protein M948_09955 [Virgibacillus sp. CM-4]MYL43441.1 NUDIX domain-containing protein [Virgibacillus massiliensis]GGJ71423.1 putative ADP-ribose pyrophosphatase YjhB [Virgibacillus kapii]CDQ41208.1 hypothetical protein BN990_03563 [Virgibacillus massiliensis]